MSSTSTLGSVQTLTFSESAPTATVTCIDVLEVATQATIGIGALCTRPSTTSMKIFYGRDYSPGAQTLQVRGTGFGAGSTFERAILPTFTLESTTTLDKYQDFSNTWSVTPTGTGSLIYEWEYESGTDGPPLPGNVTTFVFNYWEAKAGETYSLRVTQRDESNGQFYYIVVGDDFLVLGSCSTPANCNQVVWTLSYDPGEVPLNCVDGSELRNCVKAFDTDSYIITSTYAPGSTGGTSLKLDGTIFSSPSNSNFVSFAANIECGSSLVFPSLEMTSDARAQEFPSTTFRMESQIVESGSTDYTLEWIATGGGYTGFCTTSSPNPTCTISPGSLSDGTYQYTLQLFLVCNDSSVWHTLAFTQFDYSSNNSYQIISSIIYLCMFKLNTYSDISY